MQSKYKRIKLKIRIEFNEIEKRTSAGKKKINENQKLVLGKDNKISN